MNPEAKPLIPNPSAISDVKRASSAWQSIYIASAVAFIISAQYTMFFSSLWPYLQNIAQNSEGKVTEKFFGWIVAIYSLGQMISSPIFGYWSNYIRQVRIPIIVGMLLMFTGNAIYLGLESVSFPGYLLLVSRFISGFGSGNVVLMRAYVATALEETERTRALTFVTCGQAAGLMVGPLLQLLFTPLGHPGFAIVGNFHFHMYTAPAILSNVMNCLGTCTMIWCFEEKFVGVASHVEEVGDNVGQIQPALPPYDLIAVLVCLVFRFTYTFINTNIETIGSPYAMMMFGWREKEAVVFMAIAQGFVGFLTLSFYLVIIFGKLDKRINYRIGLVIGLAVMLLFHATTYSWPFLRGNVLQANSSNHNESTVGCDVRKFDWCKNLKPVNRWFYFSMYILALGLAYPILNISNFTVFSNVLGPRRQGNQQGILQMCGSAARLVGPILISILYSAYGPTMVWNMEIIVIVFTLLLWFLFFKRLVPLEPLVPVENLYKMSVVDVAPDPSSNSQVSVPRKSKSELLHSSDGLAHSNVERSPSNNRNSIR